MPKIVFNPVASEELQLLTNKATEINITDSGAYYTGTEVETALQEIGAGTTLDSRYVNITGDSMTGQLNISYSGIGLSIELPAGSGQSVVSQFYKTGETNAFLQTANYVTSATGGGFLQTAFARGSKASPSIVVNGDRLGGFFFSGYDGDQFINGAGIFAYADNTVADNSVPTALKIETGTNTRTERMSISSSGVIVFNETGADSDIRIEGDTDVNLLFIDASTDRVGIGTATPGSKLTVVGDSMIDGSADATQLTVQAHSTQTSPLAVFETSAGVDIVRIEHTLTQAITSNFLVIEGTIPDATSSTLAGARIDITTQGTGTANSRVGFLARILAGYTGTASTIAVQANNNAAGTGSNFNSTGATQPVGNLGLNATAGTTTAGLNIGGFYAATGGNTNVAVFTKAILNKASATAIGVYSIAKNVNATAPISIGGYFGLQLSDPTLESAALIAENGTVACPIFIARDNGTNVFKIDDGGRAGQRIGTATDVFARIGGVIEVNTTQVGNVGTGEDDLMTFSVPANSLSANGDFVRFYVHGSIANSVNAKRVKVKFGATTFFDTGAAGIPISAAFDFTITGLVIRTGAATQLAYAYMNTANGTLASYVGSGTPAETLSGAITLKLTGEATANDDIVQKSFVVEWYPVDS